MATVCFALARGEQKLRLRPSHAIRAWPGSPLISPGFNRFSLATGHADAVVCTMAEDCGVNVHNKKVLRSGDEKLKKMLNIAHTRQAFGQI